ncbi:CPBP family intramembrane metalloprotease [Flavobacteriaceae bacterium]|jgi:membrane protease YdiL (CAAX protease family)|nr:CPBP family intramembrane metalloprotease [Flavobacteriaceae bacterium]
MYIKQAFKVEHDWWLYLVGVLLIFIGSQLGQIPFLIAIITKSIANGGDLSSLDYDAMMSILDLNLSLFLLLLSFAVGLVVVFLVVKYIHKQTLRSLTTSRVKIDWNRFWFAFLVWGVTTCVFILLEYYSSPENYTFNFKPIPFLILVLISIVFIPLQTSFEEYLFRGYLMQGLGVLAKNRWVPLILTSTLFGLLHIANPEIDKLGYVLLVHYIGTGFLLGIMTLMDEGLELALGFHAANNLIAALLLTADWTAFQTHSILKDISDPEMSNVEVFFPVFVIYPILLIVFAKKYEWTNWKEKLFGTVTNN